MCKSRVSHETGVEVGYHMKLHFNHCHCYSTHQKLILNAESSEKMAVAGCPRIIAMKN